MRTCFPLSFPPLRLEINNISRNQVRFGAAWSIDEGRLVSGHYSIGTTAVNCLNSRDHPTHRDWTTKLHTDVSHFSFPSPFLLFLRPFFFFFFFEEFWPTFAAVEFGFRTKARGETEGERGRTRETEGDRRRPKETEGDRRETEGDRRRPKENFIPGCLLYFWCYVSIKYDFSCLCV